MNTDEQMSTQNNIYIELLSRILQLQQLDLTTCENTENDHDTERDIDPELFVFSSTDTNCEYYTNEQINTNFITKKPLM